MQVKSFISEDKCRQDVKYKENVYFLLKNKTFTGDFHLEQLCHGLALSCLCKFTL